MLGLKTNTSSCSLHGPVQSGRSGFCGTRGGHEDTASQVSCPKNNPRKESKRLWHQGPADQCGPSHCEGRVPTEMTSARRQNTKGRLGGK